MFRIRALLTVLSSSSLSLVLIFGLTACGGGGGGGAPAAPTVDNGQTASNKISHNAGKDCLNCHKTGGIAAGNATFYAAGTVYKSNGSVQAGATVRLYVRDTNTIVVSMKTDDSGNFYTEQPIEGLMTTGLNTEVEGPGGLRRTMPGVVSNGGCSVCHGNRGVGKIISN